MIKTTCPKCGYEYDLDAEISKEVNQKISENQLLREQLEEIKVNSEKEKIELRKELEEEIRNSSEKEKIELRKELEEEIKNQTKNEIKEIIEETTYELNRSFRDKEQKYADEINALKMQIEKTKDATRKASDVADPTSNDIKGKLGESNLEILIRSLFPNDTIVKIGTRGGGDFIQTVVEGNHKCGKILYECKYAEKFNRSDWISKIREDSLVDNCDRNVIVTKVMPVGKDDGGNDIRIGKIDPCRIDGVWICTYNSVEGVISLLRDGIVHQDIANVSQFDRSNKKEDLYEYVISNEFISDGNNFRDTLVKRRDYLEDYLKRTVRSIKVQITETSGLITKFDSMFSRISDITGKCADTEIIEETDDEEFLRSIIDNNKSKTKKSRNNWDKGQSTIEDAW